MVFCLLIIFIIIPALNLNEYNDSNNHIFDFNSIPSLTDNNEDHYLEIELKNPFFSIQPFQQPRILFVVDNPISLNVDKDVRFFDFMNKSLNYNVVCHESNDSYSYENFDAIVISSSVGEESTVDSLSNVPIPIFTMQAGHNNEFQLGDDFSIKDSDKFYINDGDHYVSQNFDNKSFFTVYGAADPIGYIYDYTAVPIGAEINPIAVRVVKKESVYFQEDAVWLVLDKGDKDWNLTASPERRAFWGAYLGNSLTLSGWESWNRTLSWILYDDIPGNSTIKVEVLDLDNKTVSNAQVTLTDSGNHSVSWSQNTSSYGYTTFSNVPFGYYNITVEYEDSINTDLQFLEVAGERTYDIEPFLSYTVQIDEYSDNDPPIITDIQFNPLNSNFSASIYDVSNIDHVNLSLTVRDSSNGSLLRDTVYNMVSRNNLLYFNDSALQGLPLTGLSVLYNITATDVALNIEVSENKFFTLGDLNAPIVNSYNVTDNEDGSLVFYANITDTESLVQDVVLRINDTYENMYVNASGYWIFEKPAHFGLVLNYSIFSATDSVGNVNNDSINPNFGLITPQDSVEPLIYAVSDTLDTHEEGFVTFRATVEESNEFQSGINVSSVSVLLSIFNGTLWDNDTFYPMTALGVITYEFEYHFRYNDTVVYQIVAADLARNLNFGDEHNDTIDDNAIPKLSFNAQEFGNGVVEFNSTVVDWPYNATVVTLHFTQDYFGTWSNVSMTNITENLYIFQVSNFDFRLQDVWYYTTAIDQSSNLYEPTSDQYQKVELSDIIAPQIFFIIENSTSIDGQIFITSWANDPYGDTPNINNTFYINFTKQGVTSQYEMNYDSFYFYKFNHVFNYNDEINIEIWTTDSVGNIGKIDRTIIIGDFSAPKILNTGIFEYQNGTVTFWAEVIEFSTGSGLPAEKSSVKLEYVFISSFNVSMSWNGSENVYIYTVSGFVPGNAFTYRVSAFDNSNNSAVTFWNKENIEDKTPPIINSSGYSETLTNHTFTRLDFWVDAIDTFGSVVGVTLTVNYFNTTSWIIVDGEMVNTGSYYAYSLYLWCNTSFNYSIQVYDAKPNIIVINDSNLRTYWGPVIIKSGIRQNIDNSLTVWANISDWGSGISEVTLEYEFIPQGGSGGNAAHLQVETISMEFNGSLYISELIFSEAGTLSWTIIAKDELNSFTATESSPQPFFISLPTESVIWEDLLPVIFAVAIIPLVIVFTIASVRRRRSRRIQQKKDIERALAKRFTDILSMRSIICRNKHGIPFYTTNFMAEDQDLDLTAGLASAVSSLVSEVSQRAMKKGEFDLIEREGFSILSHHGEYSTISLVSEGKLSLYMRDRISKLHNELESRFTQEQLEDPMFGDHPELIRGLVYKYLNVGLLSKLTIDFQRFKELEKDFSEDERKFITYLAEIPPLDDGQISFYVTTFTSSITRHGASLALAYTLLEKCFKLRIIYPITF
ncbi:hypothetical protein CEE45_13710 [Candidatus Heimdallarchaeota archaeon B3_Heim]|nr:MAG: hypothetical protein CEE45_13710 [Candidatus Heimdallarchaeota archaeon B3_Heim]